MVLSSVDIPYEEKGGSEETLVDGTKVSPKEEHNQRELSKHEK